MYRISSSCAHMYIYAILSEIRLHQPLTSNRISNAHRHRSGKLYGSSPVRHRCEYKLLSASARQSIAVVVVTHPRAHLQSRRVRARRRRRGSTSDELCVAHFVNLWNFNEGKRVQTLRRQLSSTELVSYGFCEQFAREHRQNINCDWNWLWFCVLLWRSLMFVFKLQSCYITILHRAIMYVRIDWNGWHMHWICAANGHNSTEFPLDGDVCVCARARAWRLGSRQPQINVFAHTNTTHTNQQQPCFIHCNARFSRFYTQIVIITLCVCMFVCMSVICAVMLGCRVTHARFCVMFMFTRAMVRSPSAATTYSRRRRRRRRRLSHSCALIKIDYLYNNARRQRNARSLFHMRWLMVIWALALCQRVNTRKTFARTGTGDVRAANTLQCAALSCERRTLMKM